MREMEQGKETLKLHKINQVLALLTRDNKKISATSAKKWKAQRQVPNRTYPRQRGYHSDSLMKRLIRSFTMRL